MEYSKKTIKAIAIGIIVALLFMISTACSSDKQQPSDQDPSDSQTGDSTTAESVEIDAQMEEELISFLEVFSDCCSERYKDSEEGLASYHNYSSPDFGVLQAIIANYLVLDHDTYAEICPYKLKHKWVSIDDDHMDPEGKGADHSLSYIEADEKAVNWIAENVFNVSEENIQKELDFTSKITTKESFFFPLYLHDGKYYYCPAPRGGPGYAINIKSISLEDEHYIIDYEDGIWWYSEENVDWKPYTKRAEMQYKTTEDGKGYWSLYNVSVVEEE